MLNTGSIVPICLAAAMALLSWPGTALATDQVHVINGCGDDTKGSIELMSPRPGETFPEGRFVPIELRVRCRGGIGILLGIDEIGYDVDRDGVLFPVKEYAGCPRDLDCWPGLATGAETSFKVRLPPGTHVLDIGASYYGSSLPSFRGFEVPFQVGELAFTGGPGQSWRLAGSALLAFGALMLVWLGRHRPEIPGS